ENRRILCNKCNTLKSDMIGIQEDGLVLCSNHVRPRRRAATLKKMALWTLAAGTGCIVCGVGPREGIVITEKKNSKLPWTYGNLRITCRRHSGCGAKGWLHYPGFPEGTPSTTSIR